MPAVVATREPRDRVKRQAYGVRASESGLRISDSSESL
jgi:hypothetical protein